jgi:hypothetical protein
MPDENEKIARKIANSQSFDGYSAWRMLKDIRNQIFLLERTKAAVPIELIRLRWLIARARELRKQTGNSITVLSEDSSKKSVRSGSAEEFDAFDFVDRYRALGGSRVAWAMGDRIRLGSMENDTDESYLLWTRTWSQAPLPRQEAILEALLERGRY